MDAFATFRDFVATDDDIKNAITAMNIPESYEMRTGVLYGFGSWTNKKYKEIIWEQQTDSGWQRINRWDYTLLVAPLQTTDYRLTVIDHDNNKIEYDYVTITVDDSANTLFFHPTYQVDSTVYFTSTPSYMNHYLLYSWDFDDGSTGSTLQNPYHTFPRFDSTYYVCLTATNTCGTYIFCDSVHVDSISLQYGAYGKMADQSNTQNDAQVIATRNVATGTGNYLSVNVPNPFSSETVVQYALADGYHHAEIRITSPLGMQLNTYKLNQQKGLIVIDGSRLRDGMYYYTLVVDGSVVKSKVMVVQK
jgi:hypothetical protein